MAMRATTRARIIRDWVYRPLELLSLNPPPTTAELQEGMFSRASADDVRTRKYSAEIERLIDRLKGIYLQVRAIETAYAMGPPGEGGEG